MNYLLDTHAFLWYIDGHSNLSANAKLAIEDNRATKYISILSLWEITIKVSLNKLYLTHSFEKLTEIIRANGFYILQIEFGHLVELKKTPLFS